ncbi:MAG: DUF2284 domain-containing protein [Chloroflexi bacterium]|nr:DUF2284 domain-containing protein [Chloroflexota bacterium]
MEISTISKFASQIGIETCRDLDPALLVPQEAIRGFCIDNRCGCYGKNHMCPPEVGTIEEMKTRLGGFKRGILLQYSKPVDVANNRKAVTQVKVEFHHKILQMEEFLKGERAAWGLIGGSCSLCEPCKATRQEPCAHPDKARTSMEAAGINVLSLLRKLGLDNQFYPDKITWTGCVLY